MNDTQKLALLNLAVAFTASTKDCRHYLWAVHIQSGSLYASDGHKAIRIMPKNGSFAYDDISYTGESVRDAVKVKRLELLQTQACNPPKFDRLCVQVAGKLPANAFFNPKLLLDSIRAIANYSKAHVEFTTNGHEDASILSLSDEVAIIDIYIMPIMQQKTPEHTA